MRPIYRFLLLFLFLSPLTSMAQDVLFKTDGSKEEVKMLEISSTEVRFKKFSNLDGPVYVLPRTETVMVIYENGVHEVLSVKETVATPTPGYSGSRRNYGSRDPQLLDETPYQKKRNLVGINYFNLLFQDVTIHYERIILDGKFGVKVPLDIGFGTQLFAPSNNVISSGLHLHFYPNGQGKVRYYTGPAVKFGSMRTWSFQQDDWGNWDNIQSTKAYYGVYYLNGVNLQASPSVNVAFELGLGVSDKGTDGGAASINAIGGLSTIIRF